MTTDNTQLTTYFNALDSNTEAVLEKRLERYRDQLVQDGYEVVLARGTQGFFAGVLVIDDERGRFGFLEENGSVTWITGTMGNIGALGTAVAQNPTDELDQSIDGLENANVE